MTLAAGNRQLPLRLAGPDTPSENEEEDEDDLELESDEEQSQLPATTSRPGTSDGGTATQGRDGTINPSFP